MLSIVLAVLLLYARIAHAGTVAASGVQGIDWTFWLALAGAALGGLSAVLHVVAPRTKATWDDGLRDDVDEVLAWFRGAKPTLNMTPVKGSPGPFGGAAMLAVLLLGAAGAGLAMGPGCTSAERSAAATAAGHALINCTAQTIGTTPGLDVATLVAIANTVAAERAKCMTPTGLDWKCVETDAIGQGVTLGGCAFVQLVAAAAKAVTSAGSSLAANPAPPPGRVELERFRASVAGGATFRTASGDQ